MAEKSVYRHIVDPTFFDDVLHEFDIKVDWYVRTDKTVNDMGQLVNGYTKKKIVGSLQSKGVDLKLQKEGNMEEMRYDFFCKSLYRIKNGDFIEYKHRYLMVEHVQDYDEWGVREASLIEVNLMQYNDLAEYIKYLNGEIIVWYQQFKVIINSLKILEYVWLLNLN